MQHRLNVQRLRAKGIALGLVDQREDSPERISALVFHSGLTTAAQLTEVSGRGVGMDAVKNDLRQVGADIAISLREGRKRDDFQSFQLVITLPKAQFLANAPVG